MYWHWIEMERTLNQWSVAAEIGLDAIKRVPDDQFVRYQTGYALWQQSKQLHRQLEERTVPVLRQAITILRSAVVKPETLTSSNNRKTNSKAYRALTYAFADLVRYLREEKACRQRSNATRRPARTCEDPFGMGNGTPGRRVPEFGAG